ncbi:MAG: alpha-beta hydrolase superfamily lysophospholipase [Arenicella sp.]|jgi:alpha-beta hydrolase superfamily lysophospholipase
MTIASEQSNGATEVHDSTENGLYYRHWPATNTKAVVMLVHGLGEHCHRYEHLAAHLNQAGYALSSMDLPCHGRSDGTRGHIDSFEVFENAVLELYRRTTDAIPNTPIFLLGHSMGGLIAARLLLNHQDKFNGALLSGAAMQSPQEPPAWQVAVIRFVARFFPKAKMLALDASAVSRDPAVVDKYMADPLVSKDKLSAQFLVSMTDAMEKCKEGGAKITLPLKIMHGSADVMTAPEGSQILHDAVSSSDKQITIYDGLFHEIFNEPEAETIFSEMVSWMDARVS